MRLCVYLDLCSFFFGMTFDGLFSMERHDLIFIVARTYKEVEKVQCSQSQDGNKMIVKIKFAIVNIVC